MRLRARPQPHPPTERPEPTLRNKHHPQVLTIALLNRRIITKGRNKTPDRFRTRVLTAGVTPSLHIDYKSTKVKQYHKLDQALRTETTINDSATSASTSG